MTQLDERFSDPGSTATPLVDTRDVLESAELFWMSTVRADGRPQWDRGLDVMVEGEARPVTDRAVLERLAGEWARKWDGRWRFEATDGGFQTGGEGLGLVFAVKPAKVLAFSKGSFSHTRYLPGDR